MDIAEFNKTYEKVIYKKEDGIVTITNNDTRTKNSARTLFPGLTQAARMISADPEVRVVIITGANEPGAQHQAFCSGGNVKTFYDRVQKIKKGEPLDEQAWFRSHYLPLRMLTGSLKALRQPIIGMVNGDAVGAGMTLLMHCDIAIAADTARFCHGYGRMGLSAGGGGEWVWARKVGLRNSCYLAFTQKFFDAKEAKELGVVNEVVPAAELEEATYELARTIAAQPPVAISQIKENLYFSMETPYNVMFTHSMFCHQHAFNSEEHAEAVSAFIEKRKPVFKDPPPPDSDPFTPY